MLTLRTGTLFPAPPRRIAASRIVPAPIRKTGRAKSVLGRGPNYLSSMNGKERK